MERAARWGRMVFEMRAARQCSRVFEGAADAAASRSAPVPKPQSLGSWHGVVTRGLREHVRDLFQIKLALGRLS